VPDFNTDAHHNWVIYIEPNEFARILDAAASVMGGPDSKQVAAALVPSLTSLLRIATECSLELTAPLRATKPHDGPIVF
jgi:hypothetical protein